MYPHKYIQVKYTAEICDHISSAIWLCTHYICYVTIYTVLWPFTTVLCDYRVILWPYAVVLCAYRELYVTIYISAVTIEAVLYDRTPQCCMWLYKSIICVSIYSSSMWRHTSVLLPHRVVLCVHWDHCYVTIYRISIWPYTADLLYIYKYYVIIKSIVCNNNQLSSTVLWIQIKQSNVTK